MASQPQPLHPAVPCASATGTGLATSSPERGTTRPKPPIRPKPRVLPKPAVPAKPLLPPPTPGQCHPCPELPSAEKMNRLAGPQPYSGGGIGGPVRRPSFTIKSPETPNGKGIPSPPAVATEDPVLVPSEEEPLAPPTLSRKGPTPFKVTPVPVAAKPERFPGTTVEEILAKMDSREGPGSPSRARLSPFCPDPSPRFGSKTFAAFRRRPSGETDRGPLGEAPWAPQPAAGEPGTGNDGHPAAETSSSPPTGPCCTRDPRGCRRPPSPPDLSFLQPGTLGPPGSPRPPACPAPAPGAPFQPTEPSASAPGSPDASPELPAPGSPTLAPSSPESLAQPPAETSVLALGAPSSSAKPQLSVSCCPGSPHTPGERSPGAASPPGTPELPPRVTCPPGSPEAVAQYRATPSPLPANVSRPPGSPEGPDDSPVSPQPPEGSAPPSQDLGLWCSPEGALQPPEAGQGLGVLGGSLNTLSCPGDPLSELSLGSESTWGLSQSFEWMFPSRGAQRPVSPPPSPIPEAASSGLPDKGEDLGPGPPRSRGNSSSEGAPCPGGPVAQRESEEEEKEEEEEKGEAGQGATTPCSPPCMTEPSQDPAEPEHPTQPGLPTETTPLGRAPRDPTAAAGSGSARLPVGDCPESLQGPGGPGRAEEPSSGRDANADPGWLTELLSSPGAHAAGHGSPGAEGSEDLLGWSRKDLSSEFGIGRAHRASTFDWSPKAVARERDWPGETEQDRAFGTKSSWDSPPSAQDRDRPDGPFGAAGQDWGGGCRGTELLGEAGPGCARWPESPGTGQSRRRDRDFGAGDPEWGTGYGLCSTGSGELGAGQADWSVGHGQQRDGESGWARGYGPGRSESRDGETAPAWAREYGTRGAETRDEELPPSWASGYSVRDAKAQDKDFTLGWAGRSSTEHTGSPEKEFSPSRPGWDSQYSTRDMENQDREFSPSRPAWDDRYSSRDKESQDRDIETWDREFKPSRPTWDDEHSSRGVQSQDQEFSPSQPAEAREYHDTDEVVKPSRPPWDDGYSTGDTETWDRNMESQDQEFSPSQPAWDDRYSTRDMEAQGRAMETQDSGFSPSRAAWDDRYSSRDKESQDRDMETWDREFKPSKLAWDDEHSSRDVQSQDQEFSPSQLCWASEHSSREMETQDSGVSPSQPSWDDRYSSRDVETRVRDMETQDQQFSPSRPPCAGGSSSTKTKKEDTEFGAGRLSWVGECGVSHTELGDAFGVEKDESPGSCVPDPWVQEPSWGSTHHQESGATESRDWAEELGGAQRHSQFGVIGTERAPDHSSTGASPAGSVSWAGGTGSGAWHEPLGDWHRDLSFGTTAAASLTGTGDAGGVAPSQAWGEELGSEAMVEAPGWSQDLGAASWSDAEAQRREWVSAFGARCAARSRDFGAGEQSLGDDAGSADGSICLPDPSPPMGNPPVAPPAAEPARSEPPSTTEEERDPPEPLPSPRASPLLSAADDGTLPDTESEGAPSDHLDGERPSSWEDKRLSLGALHPEGPTDPSGQEFTFLEDTEVLDSSVYRSKASLGRKRRHRAPALRPAATAQGDAWIFRDSTEPRPARPAASDEDEEAAEEPKSRRVRSSPLGRAVKVPLFPGLSTAALKAKLRGRNRSAEEGAVPGDSKGPPTKDSHVQRSKSCKIPSLSGKPPVLPPKPEKSSGSEASPPHWLQALKLKKKKP